MEDRREQAKALYAEGLTYLEVGQRLGVGKTTAQRWCKPDLDARMRAASLRWKDAHREANRARDRAYAERPGRQGRCVVCGGPTRRREHERCRGCISAIADARRSIAEGMWAAGWSLREMCSVFGVSRAYFSAMRTRGWDLPYRYKGTKRQVTAA